MSNFTPTPIQQQVFTLSWLASQAPGGHSEETGSTGGDTPDHMWTTQELQAAIDNLQGTISDWKWKVVWGPDYSTILNDPANAMFVAQQDDGEGGQVYVVAIAGTYAGSPHDLVEDTDIDPADWTLKGYDNSKNLKVTSGDKDGLTKLLGMNLGSNGIHAFLNGVADKTNATLWFTGHSLGGALAPMLMLALMDPNAVLDTSKTNLTLWKQVNLLSTAGPSIGNKEFVQYFRQVFDAPNVTSTFIWNANDVVPHAWSSDSMQALTSPKNIYGIQFDPNSSLAADIKKKQDAAANANPPYVMFEPTPLFTHELQGYIESSEWTPDNQFMAQLGYQHLNAYIGQFGCSWFTLPDPCANPGNKAEITTGRVTAGTAAPSGAVA